MNFDFLEKPDNWSTDEYLKYLYIHKSEFDLSWQDIADIMNRYETQAYKEDRYRKYCKANFRQAFQSSETEETADELTLQEKLFFAKETQRLKDERTQLNALYRQVTREDYIKDIAVECAKIISENNDLTVPVFVRENSGREGILLLSDWHYGIEIDNHWNRYSPEICKKRLGNLLSSVIDFIDDYDIYKINIVNLGDLISGRIHSQIRIENKEDVVSQVMSVSELLSDFISKIASVGVVVDYYDCLDNHSRIEPNKKESLRLESLARFITWYLQERFKDTNNINIKFNKYSDDIITFGCLNWTVAGVHGDLDSQKSVVKNMRGMLSERPDLICTAHLHHFSAGEENDCFVISNPSLMGTDSYAESKRLTSRPAQTFIVATDQSPVYAIHRIVCE